MRGTTLEPAWSKYQEQVATFFRDLGHDAETNVTLVGARGKHAVDVLVTSTAAGVPIRWVVECKAWATAIPKERVLTLDGIVKDVGADRGFLVAESGFQAGAFRATKHTNITLTSLAELHEETALLSARPAASGYVTRIEVLNADCSALWYWAPEPIGAGAFDEETFMSHAVRVHELHSVALPRIVEGQYPVVVHDDGRARVAGTRQELLQMLADLVPVTEANSDRLWDMVASRASEGAGLVGQFIEAVRGLVMSGRALGQAREELSNVDESVEQFRLALNNAVVAAQSAEAVVTKEPKVQIKVLNRLVLVPAGAAAYTGTPQRLNESMVERLLSDLEHALMKQALRPSRQPDTSATD